MQRTDIKEFKGLPVIGSKSQGVIFKIPDFLSESFRLASICGSFLPSVFMQTQSADKTIIHDKYKA